MLNMVWTVEKCQGRVRESNLEKNVVTLVGNEGLWGGSIIMYVGDWQ